MTVSSSLSQLIAELHQSPGKLVLAVTGGGSQAISALLEVPGASRTVLEASVPYASEALVRLLGAMPEKYCSEETARLMAMAAYRRAVEFAGLHHDDSVAGIACTASLASDRPKHGPHRIHVALQTRSLTLSHSLTLVKDRRNRAEEEHLAAAMVLNLVAEFKGQPLRLDVPLLPEEAMAVERCDAPVTWQRLFSGELPLVPATAAARSPADRRRRLIFSGAFHPRHDGHREMARLAAERLGLPVEHELSIVNVDKPPIDYIEIRRRVEQFGEQEPLWLTSSPTFLEKASLFSPATFIVGADTLARIADAKYYGGADGRDRALDALADSEARFLVFGRHYDGAFHTLRTLRIPDALSKVCDELSEYRRDVSSTLLRQAAATSAEVPRG